jgi:sec-independent protein translocase protein TatA
MRNTAAFLPVLPGEAVDFLRAIYAFSHNVLICFFFYLCVCSNRITDQMSGQEIVIIIIVALLLFGADKLPEIARGIGKGMRDFRKATDDIKREFEESTSEIRKDFQEVTNTISGEVRDISNNIQKDVDDITNNLQQEVSDFKNDLESGVNEVKTKSRVRCRRDKGEF